MSETKHTPIGDPAYPSQQRMELDGQWNQTYQPGMSLRDWFAGQALVALVRPDVEDGALPCHLKAISTAEDAYLYADAMLAERAIGDA